MPPEKPKSNLRAINQWQRDAARAEYLRHPDASISEVAKATNVGIRTVARAREQLVKEGLIPAGRNATDTGADAAALAVAAKSLPVTGGSAEDDPDLDDSDVTGGNGAPETPIAPPKPKKGSVIDGEAMRALGELLDELEDADDETTRKQMLRQVKRFAFDPQLHADTRMSASQLWAKLVDMQRAREQGPGVPMTFAAAKQRCVDFLKACGAKVAVPAFYEAFNLTEETSDGAQSTQGVVSADAAPASTGTAGTPDNDSSSEGNA